MIIQQSIYYLNIIMKLESLHIFPVKSLCGIALNEAHVTPQGLLGDRLWLIATAHGEMVTARKHPKLLLWHTKQDIFSGSLSIIFPDLTNLQTTTTLFTQPAKVTVWKDQFQAYHGDKIADALLSEKLGFNVRLYWLGQQSNRQVHNINQPLTFADTAPFLLTNLSSLADLNHHLSEAITIDTFRGNIVISGSEPYAEETWQKIQIGDIRFHLYKPCIRCVMTTINLQTGEKHPKQQPLKYLANQRNTIFGMNMRAENTGIIRVGDDVKILA